MEGFICGLAYVVTVLFCILVILGTMKEFNNDVDL